MLVRWIGNDGGWKMARIVRIHLPWRLEVLLDMVSFMNYTLVQHTCTGELEFIDLSRTTSVPNRRD